MLVMMSKAGLLIKKNDRLKDACLRKIVGEDLTDEVMFEQRPE